MLRNSKSLLGIAVGLGLARHFRVVVRTRSCFLWLADRSVPFGKIGQMMVSNGVIGAIFS